MKYLICAFLVFAAITTTAQSQPVYLGDTFEEALEKGSADLTITYVETPAFVYRNENGELIGICVDIIESFSNFMKNKYDVTLNLNYSGDGENFQVFYKNVMKSEGGVIGLGNVTVRESRKSEVTFTPPFIKNIALLVSQGSVPDVTEYEQIPQIMSGFTAYVPKGTTHESRVQTIKNEYYPGLKIAYSESSKGALDLVVENPKSFCYQDIALYWSYKQQNANIKYHPLDKQDSEDLAMIMPLNSDWQPVFEEFFEIGGGFKSSSIYRNSLVKHLGPEVVSMLRMAQ